MKIGILTIHTSFNYGAMLQAFALQAAIMKLGYNVQIIDYYPKELERSNLLRNITSDAKQIIKYLYARFNPNIQKKIHRFDKFRNQMQLTKRYYNKKELYQNPPSFDIYMVGSDQVWNMEKGFDPFWFLDFINHKPKISYASSFGTVTIPNEHKEKLKKYLSSFEDISVRENDGVIIIKEAANLEASQVLDPTFLLTRSEWSRLGAKRQYEGEYILAYGFSNSIEFIQLIDNVKKRYPLPVIAIAIGVHSSINADKCFINTGPNEFIALFRDAKAICTDSFHGLAFSIHFRKTFFTIPHPTRNSRLKSLLDLLKLNERQFSDSSMVLKLKEEELNINYENIEALIQINIEKSMKFLKNSIEKASGDILA